MQQTPQRYQLSMVSRQRVIAHFPLFHATMTSIYKNRNLMRFSFWLYAKLLFTEITTPNRSNDKQITDTSATTLSFSSIVSTTNIPERKSLVPFLSAKSRPESDVLSIFTSEALVICAVLSILILSVTLVSISIALKRKKSSTRRHRRLTHPSHIKPMYHGRHDFYYYP